MSTDNQSWQNNICHHIMKNNANLLETKYVNSLNMTLNIAIQTSVGTIKLLAYI